MESQPYIAKAYLKMKLKLIHNFIHNKWCIYYPRACQSLVSDGAVLNKTLVSIAIDLVV